MKKLSVTLIGLLFLVACDEGDNSVGGDFSDGTGQGGSLARLGIIDDNLYVANPNEIVTFSLKDPGNPVPLARTNPPNTLETIFTYQNRIVFVGTTTGLLIYEAQGFNLQLLSEYRHVTACDPVIAEGNYAYVTLRSDSNSNICQRGFDQLEILDISNLSNPQLINTVSLINPRGLAKYGDTLLVCDRGVKAFDVRNPQKVEFITADADIDAVDLIALDSLIIAVGNRSLRQYLYKNERLELLSEL